MDSAQESAEFRVYLLTVWREPSQNPDDPAAWRFRLENPGTGWHNGYAGMDALLAALPGEIMGEDAPGDWGVDE